MTPTLLRLMVKHKCKLIPFVLFCYDRSAIEQGVEYPVDRLVFGTGELEDGLTCEQAGLETESTVDALVSLDGGKRKRKKKVYTKPKKNSNQCNAQNTISNNINIQLGQCVKYS